MSFLALISVAERGFDISNNIKITSKFLKDNPSLLVTKADKGNSTVIITKEGYRNKMLESLSDQKYYRRVDGNPLKSLIKNMEKLITTWVEKDAFKVWKQTCGTPMGGNSSPLWAEFSLEYLETRCLESLGDSVLFYARYVDDALLVVKESDIGLVLDTFNNQSDCLQFTLELETDNKISFLDLESLVAIAMDNIPRKLKCLEIKQKVEIIKEVEANQQKKKEIAGKYRIPASPSSTIRENKEKILERFSSGDCSRKRKSAPNYPDVDEAIMK
ncbi:hypothetical protein QAD02_023578 [Eretmocerus hayati]|uniref:Uncharacterized protein n=1 Tax=Eretmocerus hayati TaxID=131215 RepID=A0ACC2PYP4_9HYME|nr:hypothetical protein QAD02_023578 [Eretmocerus hayati]